MKKRRKIKLKHGYEKYILCIIGILVLCLFGSFLKSILTFKPYYLLESRISKVNESKKLDSDGFTTVGWLKVQGSKIDMPILKSDGIYPVKLEEYAWTMADDIHYHNVFNIMGHNIFNLGTSLTVHSDNFHRLEDVMSFAYYDVAKENKYIQFTIDGEEYLYKIFAASFLYDSDVYMLPTGDFKESDVQAYLDLLKKTSIYDYDVDTKLDDHYISIITCTRLFGTDNVTTEFLIAGRRIRDGEKINDYKVKKNDRYEKVENTLKGEKYEEDSI